MTTAADRLRGARENAGFATAVEAAASVGEKISTYIGHENGQRGYPATKARKYARAFKVTPEWLLYGTAMKSRSAGVPILGRVAAGAEGNFIDDFELGAADDYLPDLDLAGRICLVVEGDSMVPRFRPGEKVIFGPRLEDPTSLIGREVMARLVDGRKLLKVLRRGSRPGLWTLYSVNSAYDPIEDVELEWALPFEELRA